MNKLEKYHQMPEATITKKVMRWLIDHLIFLIVSILLTLTIGFRCLKNNEDFKSINQNCFDEITQMYQMEVDAKLTTFKEDTKRQVIPIKNHFENYLKKMLSLSYSLHADELSKLKEYENVEKLTLENDEVSYYFISYTKKYEKNEFYEKVFFHYFDKKYFENIQTFPSFKVETSKKVYQYLKDSHQENETYFDLYDAFVNINEVALNDLFELEEFQIHFKQYETYFNEMSKYEVIVLEIIFICTYVLYFILPSIIYPNITLGHLICKTRMVGKLHSHLISNLIQFLSSHFIVILVSLFTFGISVLTLEIGFFTYLQLLLISLFLFGLDFICLCFHKLHLSGIEYFTGSRIVDVKYYVKGDNKLN